VQIADGLPLKPVATGFRRHYQRPQ